MLEMAWRMEEDLLVQDRDHCGLPEQNAFTDENT